MAKVESSDGGDATKAILERVRENEMDVAGKFINLWFQESQDWLYQAAETRTKVGVAHGRTGRKTNGLHEIARGAVPPVYNKQDERWEFSYPHSGAVFQEYGAQPHDIRAKHAEMLAFEWPDAPKEIKEQFEHTEGDLVFFESINHPGIPAIGFVRYGRQKAKREMEEAGLSTETFTDT